MHTPTPWSILKFDDEPTECICNDQGDIRIATMNYPDDAALIVKAVNSYAAMKQALEEARNVLVNQQLNAAKTLAGESYFAMTGLDSTIMKIRHALTLAEGA